MKKQITSEELQKLKELQSNYAKLVNDFGSLELQIIELENQKENLNSQKGALKAQLKFLRDEEIVLAKDLNDKYGKGIIDIETGQISDN